MSAITEWLSPFRDISFAGLALSGSGYPYIVLYNSFFYPVFEIPASVSSRDESNWSMDLKILLRKPVMARIARAVEKSIETLQRHLELLKLSYFVVLRISIAAVCDNIPSR